MKTAQLRNGKENSQINAQNNTCINTMSTLQNINDKAARKYSQ